MIVTPPGDREGRVYGLTWPQPLRFWGLPILRVLFWAARNMAWVTRPLREDITVIRAAYWSVLRRVPDGQGGHRPLRRPVLFFDASFDVDLRRYIELFAEALRWRFRVLWGSGTGYPGVLPAEGFLVWVDEHRAEPSHYWCAYPESTTKMVRSALRIDAELEKFDATTAHLAADKFAIEFDRLVADLANDL